MDDFKGIRFKKKTAKRFQIFSKTYFTSHSEAMEEMLDFFHYNELSPKERLGPNGRRLEHIIKKRINAVIAILRDVEKTQTKPTRAMIESLFEQEEQASKGVLREKKFREVAPQSSKSGQRLDN